MTPIKQVLLSFFLLLLVTGCAPVITNLTPADLKFEPSIQSYRDPKFDSTTFKTFSVFPYSLISDKAQLRGEIIEKQMLFALRRFPLAILMTCIGMMISSRECQFEGSLYISKPSLNG